MNRNSFYELTPYHIDHDSRLDSLFHIIIESMKFVQFILDNITKDTVFNHDYSPCKISDNKSMEKLKDKSWTSITIMKGNYIHSKENLEICDFSNLQYIHLETVHFPNVKCLTLSNLPELKSLSMEAEVMCNTSLSLSSQIHLFS